MYGSKRASLFKSASGEAVCRLSDESTGAGALISLSRGFNLYELWLPAGGEVRSIIASSDGWPDEAGQATRNGMPVLFPFPNRIRGGRFRFGGSDYTIPVNKPPHAIHGFAVDAPFELVGYGADEESAYVAGAFQISRQAPERLDCWPGDLRLTMRYSLSGAVLLLEATVENPGLAPVPWGFGLHSYFHGPAAGARENGSVPREAGYAVIPASEYWVLDDGRVPTGERRVVSERLDFREPRGWQGVSYDDVLTGLGFDSSGWCRIQMGARESGAAFTVALDRTFREVVVFTPGWFEGVLALEPYTQTTDAINLAERGIDAGLQILPPGGRHTFGLAIAGIGAIE